MNVFSGKRNILWDFDGVIIESRIVRRKGFIQVLSEFPNEQVEQLLNYHENNGGLSRYVKFRYFFEVIRREKVTEESILNYSRKFSDIMRAELANKDFLNNEVLDFIKLHEQEFEMHIVSGSDGNELKFLCERLEISHYFRSIVGSPTSKGELIEQIMKNYGYENSETIFIGDSINDFEASHENKISFLGYNNCEIKDLGTGYIQSFLKI